MRTLVARCALVGVAALALGACASATRMPDADRASLTRELEGRLLYLRSSLWVLPFFSDPSRRLVSAVPPDSIELLVDPSGAPILPGEPEALLQLGTRVQIDRVEFPTSLAVTRRPLYSPRTEPWIYFHAAGERPRRPFIAVLRPGLRTRQEFLAALDTFFSTDDPAHWLERYPADVQAAIRAKKLVAGMDGAAIELAWGKPERIEISHPQGSTVAVWTWPLGKRHAVLREDRLVSATPALE